jgi:hypothetical protein
MAENKKGVLVYADWIDKFEELEDDEAGRLIKHFFRYVNDLDPEYPDRTTKLMFIDIKNTLKRDLDKWEDKSPQRIEKARLAGLASAKARELKKQLESTNELEVELNPTKSTVSVSVSDNVNDIPKGNPTPTVNWEGLLKQFNEITNKNLKVVDDKSKRQFLARLKEGYTKIDIVNAITNCYNSEFHKANGHKNLTLEFISRPDKFAYYFDFKEIVVKPQIKQDKL